MRDEQDLNLSLPRKAIVFAAGLGSRMGAISDTLPKPLVKVGGKPLIDHMLDRLAEAGLDTAFVNVHHLADQIEAHLKPRSSPKIIISDERGHLLDQGGAIKKLMPVLGDEPFFICNSDSLWLEGPKNNFHLLEDAWNPSQMDILLLVAATATSAGIESAGDFYLSPDSRLIKREERSVAPFVYAGVGIIKPQLFSSERRTVFKLAPYFFESAKNGRLFGQRLDGKWLHVGTQEAIKEAEDCLIKNTIQ